ncbi:hypothetical protein LJB76_01465 [Clostridia bacterium OttesenSCG-928-O13]|nr:hypothetical protein [Clostridia bacterium OttesenSCG-928-O13]
MSVSIVLFPIALALFASVGSAATVTSIVVDQFKAKKNAARQDLPPMPTTFTDATLLEKTLQEHGLVASSVAENDLVFKTEAGLLHYHRQQAGENFYVTAEQLEDVDGLMAELACLDEEYRQNVQSFTYHQLLDNLPQNNMTLQNEQILDDNSILLTIDV